MDKQPNFADLTDTLDHSPLTSVIPRPRDDKGQPQPRVIVYAPQLSGLQKASDTSEHGLLTEIEKLSPFHAAELRAFRDGKLQAAFKALRDTKAELHEKLVNAQRLAEQRDEEIDIQVAAHAAETEQALKARQAMVVAAESAMQDARSAACRACGAVGVELHDGTTASDLLAVPKMDPTVAAERLNLPVDPEKPTYVKVLKALGSAIMGVTFGVSVGLASGILNPDTLDQAPAKLIGASVVGLAAGPLVACTAGGLFYLVATAKYGERPFLDRAVKVCAALVLTLVLVAMYAFMDSVGLMKMAKLDSGTAMPMVAALAIGGLLGLGYILFNAYDGYVHGRHHTVKARVTALCAQEFEERAEKRRQNPEVQSAVAVLAQFRRSEAALDAQVVALVQESAPFQARALQLESRRLHRPEGNSPEDQARLEDAHMQMLGTQGEYDEMLENVKAALFPPSLPARILRALGRIFHRRRYCVEGR